MPARGASAGRPIKRQSRDECRDESFDDDLNKENRTSERSEGGEGRRLGTAGAVNRGLDTGIYVS